MSTLSELPIPAHLAISETGSKIVGQPSMGDRAIRLDVLSIDPKKK